MPNRLLNVPAMKRMLCMSFAAVAKHCHSFHELFQIEIEKKCYNKENTFPLKVIVDLSILKLEIVLLIHF